MNICCRWAVALTLFGAMAVISCAETGNVGRYIDDTSAEAGAPSFTPSADASSAGDGDDASSSEHTLMCEGTECPAPYATCGTTASLRCGVNLMNDKDNCGACGHACADYPSLNMASRCVQGECVPECGARGNACGTTLYKDCNGNVDDGCEVPITDDPKNCGGCGHECAPGQGCINGFCGCPDGKTYCPGCNIFHPDACADLSRDDLNCGGCNVRCSSNFDGACSPMPANTRYGCSNSECGHLKCTPAMADCNKDLPQGCSSDGCEVDLRTDPKNCGACGNACAAGQECRDDGNGPQCVLPCEESGKSKCPDTCADLLSDPYNCGSCGNTCPLRDNAKGECRKGVCVIACADGFADCDGNPVNGCEVNLANNPTNCGACGVTCDFVGGQPCIEGQCLMVECDAGTVTK